MNTIIHLLLPLAGILVGAKVAAQLSYPIGLPAVFGELLPGLLLSPSVLGWLAPSDSPRWARQGTPAAISQCPAVRSSASPRRRLASALSGPTKPRKTRFLAPLQFEGWGLRAGLRPKSPTLKPIVKSELCL